MRLALVLAGLLALPTLLHAQAPPQPPPVPAVRPLRPFYGNLHAHTGYSDGNQDSSRSNVSTPAQSWAFARASQHFDFLGISEHNHAAAGFERRHWQPLRQQADAATENGRFVALAGMEWGVISGGGHVLVYGVDQLLGWETGNYDVLVPRSDYEALWQAINARPGAFGSCAHPNSGDYGNLRNVAFNAAADRALVGTPFRSGPANSTNVTYSNPSGGSYETYFRGLLSRGYHVGPTIDHDNHNTTFGRTTQGRTVVLADTLTRPALLAALRARRFYASDDWNAEVTLTLYAAGQYEMGSIAQEPGTPTIATLVADGDSEPVQSITLMKGVPGSGQVATVVGTAGAGMPILHVVDTQLAPGDSAYYYAVITQADGDKILTAPIWYRRGPLVVTGVAPELAAVNAVPVTVWPNPAVAAAGGVVTVAGPAGAGVTVLDALGRVVWSGAAAASGSAVVPVAGWPAAIYSVRVVTPAGGVTVRRLVVE